MSALVGVGGFFVFTIGVLYFFINFKRREKRKKAKYIMLFGFVLFVVGVFIPTEESLDTDEAAIAEDTESQIESEEVSSEIVDDDGEEIQVVGIGQPILVGDVEYIVNEVSTTDMVGSEMFGETAQGIFLVVNVTVVNHGNEALDVSDSFFNLVDGEKIYESNSMAAIHANENGDSFFVNSINPDLSLSSNVVFDVPQTIVDSQTKQLEVQTGYWGTEKGLINLQ